MFQELYRFLGRIYTHIPGLAELWASRYQARTFEDVPFVPLRKPLNQCRMSLITTGGVHLTSQEPYDMDDSRGDPTYRVIPADAPREQLMITHNYYDHTDADRDLNILLPIALFHEMVTHGHIGSLASCYSFMGHIEPPHVETLLQRTAPEVAGMLKQEQVDAVLLTPA